MATGTEAVRETKRNPWIAVALSVVVPGLGHLYLRRFWRAALWFAPLVLALVAAVFALRLDRLDLVGAAISPSVLWSLVAVNGIATLWRLAAALDAFFVDRQKGSGQRFERSFVFVGWTTIAIVVIAPHVVVNQYTMGAISLVDSVFVSANEGPPAEPVIPIGSDADIVPDPVVDQADPVVNQYDILGAEVSSSRNLVFIAGVGDPDAVTASGQILASAPNTAATSPFLGFSERVGADRITILLAGGDAGPGRGGLRTDTMMVATIDTNTGKAALFAFPRNLGQTPLPPKLATAFVELEQRLLPKPEPPVVPEGAPPDGDGDTVPPEQELEEPVPFVSCRCFPEQLNALYPFTRRWTGTFPNEIDPGMAALKETLEYVMNLKIDYYALVDMSAFVDLVDAIGGVDVYVQKPLTTEVSPEREGAEWIHLEVDVGWNYLTGAEALAYARARKGSSDYTRMQRQRCMVRAVAAQADPLTLLRSFSGIVDAVEGSVVTNIPLSFASDLMTAAARLDFDDIETVGFVPVFWAPERDYGGRPIPDIDRIRAKVRSVLNGQGSRSDLESDELSECDA